MGSEAFDDSTHWSDLAIHLSHIRQCFDLSGLRAYKEPEQSIRFSLESNDVVTHHTRNAECLAIQPSLRRQILND